MLNEVDELRSCVIYTTQQRNLRVNKRNHESNSNATIGLKALASKVLQRNSKRNLCAIREDGGRNFYEESDVDGQCSGSEEELWLSVTNKLVNVGEFYGHTAEDIEEVSKLFKNDPVGVFHALCEQEVEVELLNIYGLLWSDVPKAFTDLLNRISVIKKYSEAEQKDLLGAMDNMSPSQMLREFDLLTRKYELLDQKKNRGYL